MPHHNKENWDLQEANLFNAYLNSDEMKASRYDLGVEHCEKGIQPTNHDADYLNGYGDQYAREQSASAEEV